MARKVLVLYLVAGVLTLGACSDSSKPADSGVDGPASPDAAAPDLGLDASGPDAGVDAAGDAAADAAGDSGAREGGGADAAGDSGAREGGGADATGDATGSDATRPDAMQPDSGVPVLMGSISRSVAPLNDGKGDIHVTLSQIIFPFPLPLPIASTLVKAADLRKAGAKASYQINAGVTSGSFQISAWMDDNNNAWVPVATPSEGDLTASKAKSVTLKGTVPLRVDLVLDKVLPFSGGSTVGAIRGRISATVTPSRDGKGPVVVALFKNLPPSSPAGSATFLYSCDLSSPYARETYYFGAVTPGNYYLRAYLDDDNSSGLLGANPNKGDMIHSKPVQVRALAGTTTVSDVVLDALKK
jgi:hypothetical protein